jgi:hypothetical protein
MASLTNNEKAQVRRFLAKKSAVTWLKAAINAAAQVIQDLEDGTYVIQQSDIDPGGTTLTQLGSTKIDAATAPVVFTNQQKKWLRAKILELNFIKDSE